MNDKNVDMIEMDVAVNKLTAMQTFTRMKQIIADLERRNGELEKDVARYQWLKRNVSERLTNKSLLNEFSEHKCEFIFPKLISWADFCGQITFDEAIDMRIDEALTRTKEQR